jgi:hypothetical protein
MKKTLSLSIIFLLFFGFTGNAQNTGARQPEGPPAGFKRGMYVDCANIIVTEYAGGNSTKKTELENYVVTNEVEYLALFGLDGNVFGNPNPALAAAYETALRSIILDLRTLVPTIEIGANCSDQSFFQTTSTLFLNDWHGPVCATDPLYSRIPQWDSLINPQIWLNDSIVILPGLIIDNFFPPGSPVNKILKDAELYKSIVLAARFTEHGNSSIISDRCKAGLDFIYVEVEYWGNNDPFDARNDYNKLINCLQLGQDLRCRYTCIKNIDCEFKPVGGGAVDGKTFDEQIDEVDFLASRPSIVHYVPSANWDDTYDWRCHVFAKFASTTNKPGSRLYIQYSGEREVIKNQPAFEKCFGTVTVNQPYLGEYLNGGASPSGNMYSVEEAFRLKYDDLSYPCQYTGNTNLYTENHASVGNPYGNYIQGFLWFTYSMFLSQYNPAISQNIYRLADPEHELTTIMTNELLITPNPILETFTLQNNSADIERVELYDVQMQYLSLVQCQSKICSINKQLSSGTYILKIT